jgi:hypothetical protein
MSRRPLPRGRCRFRIQTGHRPRAAPAGAARRPNGPSRGKRAALPTLQQAEIMNGIGLITRVGDRLCEIFGAGKTPTLRSVWTPQWTARHPLRNPQGRQGDTHHRRAIIADDWAVVGRWRDAMAGGRWRCGLRRSRSRRGIPVLVVAAAGRPQPRSHRALSISPDSLISRRPPVGRTRGYRRPGRVGLTARISIAMLCSQDFYARMPPHLI